MRNWKIASLKFCVCPSFSSWPSHPFPRIFNQCNLKELKSYLSSGGGKCLFNMPNTRVMYGGQRCGNGYLEDGEECDCGEEEVFVCCVSWILQYICILPTYSTFSQDSQVLTPLILQECTSACCNANNCTLKAGAECAHGVCCHNCKVQIEETQIQDDHNSCHKNRNNLVSFNSLSFLTPPLFFSLCLAEKTRCTVSSPFWTMWPARVLWWEDRIVSR